MGACASSPHAAADQQPDLDAALPGGPIVQNAPADMLETNMMMASGYAPGPPNPVASGAVLTPVEANVDEIPMAPVGTISMPPAGAVPVAPNYGFSHDVQVFETLEEARAAANKMGHISYNDATVGNVYTEMPLPAATAQEVAAVPTTRESASFPAAAPTGDAPVQPAAGEVEAAAADLSRAVPVGPTQPVVYNYGAYPAYPAYATAPGPVAAPADGYVPANDGFGQAPAAADAVNENDQGVAEEASDVEEDDRANAKGKKKKKKKGKKKGGWSLFG